MNRKTFDVLMATAGLVVAAVLLVAGSLLVWGHQFAADNVRTQLVAQKIYFPAKGSPELADPKVGPHLNRYAGRQLTDGAQAKAYADYFIAVHLQKIGGGETYAQLSAKAMAQPANTALANQVNTVFKGETLRGMLLNAYAFWKLGQIALYAAYAAFAGAAAMLLLAALGYLHIRRVAPTTELLPNLTTASPSTPRPHPESSRIRSDGGPDRNGLSLRLRRRGRQSRGLLPPTSVPTSSTTPRRGWERIG